MTALGQTHASIWPPNVKKAAPVVYSFAEVVQFYRDLQ